MQKKKIYIIAGEKSGDFIGAKVISSLRRQNPNLDIAGIGGKMMSSEGVSSLFSIEEINIMGFLEIIPKIFKLTALISRTVKDILLFKPDILITIDSPGFTYRIATAVRRHAYKIMMLHIVAPSVWAYNPGRAKKYADLYDHLLTLLEFEPPYFQKMGLGSTYIGHIISEQRYLTDKKSIRAQKNISHSSRIICVTIGSRRGEISRHLPIFCRAINILHAKCNDIIAVFVIADGNDSVLLEYFLNHNANFKFIISEERLQSFALADVALAKSGTNTLEIAASGTPMVVAHKVNLLSYFIIKNLIKVRYISLINIIANQEIIPELIQFDCTAQKISEHLLRLITDREVAENQRNQTYEILKQMGFWDIQSIPSERAAKVILELLR